MSTWRWKNEGKVVDDESWRLLVPLIRCRRCSVMFALWSSRHGDVRCKSQSAKHRNAWVDERGTVAVRKLLRVLRIIAFSLWHINGLLFYLTTRVTHHSHRLAWRLVPQRLPLLQFAVSRGCTWSSQLVGDTPLGMHVWVDWIRRCWYVTV